MSIDWGPRDAEDFLRCGGTFTLTEWLALDQETRDGLASIARAIDADKIVALAAAITDDRARLGISALVDGGEARDRAVMGAAMHAVGERIREARKR